MYLPTVMIWIFIFMENHGRQGKLDNDTCKAIYKKNPANSMLKTPRPFRQKTNNLSVVVISWGSLFLLQILPTSLN